MLDEKRIKEAESNVKSYLDQGLLQKITVQDTNVKRILIKNADESLKVAENSLNSLSSYLWAIVCSYYSMYYISKAVLYSYNYKVGEQISHKVTADALIVYIRKKLKDSLLEDYEETKNEALEIAGLKANEIIESFDLERVKRSKFQYSMTEEAIQSKARTSLSRAKEFLFEMKKLLIK